MKKRIEGSESTPPKKSEREVFARREAEALLQRLTASPALGQDLDEARKGAWQKGSALSTIHNVHWVSQSLLVHGGCRRHDNLP